MFTCIQVLLYVFLCRFDALLRLLVPSLTVLNSIFQALVFERDQNTMGCDPSAGMKTAVKVTKLYNNYHFILYCYRHYNDLLMSWDVSDNYQMMGLIFYAYIILKFFIEQKTKKQNFVSRIKIEVDISFLKTKGRVIVFNCRHGATVANIVEKLRRILKLEGTRWIGLIRSDAKSVCRATEVIFCNSSFLLIGEGVFGTDDNVDDDEDETEVLDRSVLDNDEEREESGEQVVSLLYSNVRGGLGGQMNNEKKVAIKAVSANDTIFALCETNSLPRDVPNLAGTFGRDACVVACEEVTYDKNGKRCKPRMGRKILGYGSRDGLLILMVQLVLKLREDFLY